MRIGLSIIDPGPGPDPIARLEAQLRSVEADGFASAWMAHIFGLDALTALAAAGRSVERLELGTAVVPTYPRHPAALAQQALTTHAAIGGRLALGIGLSHQIVIENMFGFSYDKPARHMREYLDILLPLVHEGAASVSGETLSANVSLSTPREPRLPVLLAALAPRMLHLAGARGDGTVLWMTGRKTVESHIVPSINKAASDAGRPAPRVVCVLPVCVTDDVGGARERAERVFAIYGHLPSYRAMLDREGAAGPGDVAIAGDEETVTSEIRALEDAGVTDFIAAEFTEGADGARTRDVLRSLVA